MDSKDKIKIFLERAGNDLLIAKSLKKLSEDEEAKNNFIIPKETTFYSAVISHSYYAIFYAAKAILLMKNIETSSPEVHKKTFEEFEKNFVKTGELDLNLLEIYKKMIVRADELLGIFKNEKWKRGNFTYNTLPQANKEPAEDSIKNSTHFIANINKVIENMEAKEKTKQRSK